MLLLERARGATLQGGGRGAHSCGDLTVQGAGSSAVRYGRGRVQWSVSGESEIGDKGWKG